MNSVAARGVSRTTRPLAAPPLAWKQPLDICLFTRLHSAITLGSQRDPKGSVGSARPPCLPIGNILVSILTGWAPDSGL